MSCARAALGVRPQQGNLGEGLVPSWTTGQVKCELSLIERG